MNDREKWRERVRDIRATSTTWWWWWWYIYIYIKLWIVKTQSQQYLAVVSFSPMHSSGQVILVAYLGRGGWTSCGSFRVGLSYLCAFIEPSLRFINSSTQLCLVQGFPGFYHLIIAVIYINNRTLEWWFQCSQIARETWVQSPVESYQRLKNMVLDSFLV